MPFKCKNCAFFVGEGCDFNFQSASTANGTEPQDAKEVAICRDYEETDDNG
jgi:hypothetical protein